MAKRMFLAFFPGETTLADAFAASLGTKKITMAYIQGHLLRHRDSARDAAQIVSSLE